MDFDSYWVVGFDEYKIIKFYNIFVFSNVLIKCEIY